MTLLETINNITKRTSKALQKLSLIILTIMPFFLLWITIGQLIQSHLTIDRFVKVTGIVDGTKEVTTRIKKRIFYTHKDRELRVYLKDTSEYFRFMSIYNYNQFTKNIHQGDTAEIYIRPKWLIPLGMGYKNDIFQIVVNGQTLFDISKTHRNENGIAIVCILSIPLFVYLKRWAKRKMREKEKLQAT